MMTEREYINTMNLAKVRIAAQILRDYIPSDADHDQKCDEAVAAIARLCRALEGCVAEASIPTPHAP